MFGATPHRASSCGVGPDLGRMQALADAAQDARVYGTPALVRGPQGLGPAERPGASAIECDARAPAPAAPNGEGVLPPGAGRGSGAQDAGAPCPVADGRAYPYASTLSLLPPLNLSALHSGSLKDGLAPALFKPPPNVRMPVPGSAAGPGHDHNGGGILGAGAEAGHDTLALLRLVDRASACHAWAPEEGAVWAKLRALLGA